MRGLAWHTRQDWQLAKVVYELLCRLEHLRFYEQARLILKPSGVLAVW